MQYKYNKFHNVTYRKDALEYAVRASAKYISNRCLPDKAIDLMDEAGAYLEVHPVEYRQRSYVTKAIIQQILTKVCKIDAAAIKDEIMIPWLRSASAYSTRSMVRIRLWIR